MMSLQEIQNQRPGEEIKIFLRRHWIEVARIIGTYLLLFFLPLAALAISYERIVPFLMHPILGPLIALLLCVYFLSIWLFSFVDYVDYFLDTWIVTTERIINIEQVNLFRRIASELHLSDVQDVTSEVNGMLRTLLNYGRVNIQTASTAVRFDFKDISAPEAIKMQILDLVRADRERHAIHAEPSGIKPLPLATQTTTSML